MQLRLFFVSMPAMFLFPFLLTQQKQSFLLLLPLFTVSDLSLYLPLLLLELKRLLRFCAESPSLRLTLGGTLHAFRVYAPRLLHFRFKRRTESKFVNILQEPCLHLRIPRFSTEHDLCRLIASAAFPFVQSDLKWFSKQDREFHRGLLHLPFPPYL